MKKYYVHYWNSFSNTYTLCWAESAEQMEEAEKNGYERITRKQAEKLCSDEIYRRKTDYAFSGYADSVILPYGHDGDWINDRRVYKDGHIILYK